MSLRLLVRPAATLLTVWGMTITGVAAQPAPLPFDVRATSSGLAPVVALTRAPLTLAIQFQNPGTNTIWAMDVHYRIDNGPIQTIAYAFPPGGYLIAQGGRQTVPHPTRWTPPRLGQYTVRCWASNLNVVRADGNPANDTVTTRVTVVAREAPRLAVLEVFTSGSCPVCGAGAAALEALETRRGGQVASLHYPQNIPNTGDLYQTPETVGRRHYYGIQAVPYVTLDGATPKPASRLSDSDVVDRQAQPCFLALDAVFTRQPTSRRVSVLARLTALGPGASPNLVLRAVVVEPRVTPSLAANGQTYLPNLVRKLLPSSAGAAVGVLPVGTTRPFSTVWAVPLAVRNCAIGALEVVVFAQDTVTHEIQQAVRARLNGVLGTPEAAAALTCAVAPNPVERGQSPAVAYLTLPTAARVQLTVTDALGRSVLVVPNRELPAGAHVLPLDLRGVAPGVYAVCVTAGGQVLTRRLVVE